METREFSCVMGILILVGIIAFGLGIHIQEKETNYQIYMKEQYKEECYKWHLDLCNKNIDNESCTNITVWSHPACATWCNSKDEYYYNLCRANCNVNYTFCLK